MKAFEVEFHCHTWFSGDSVIDPKDLIITARKKGLDRLVVTDHNTIRGGLAAFQIDPELIIVGEEILTTRGELLAAYVKEEIPSGLNPEYAIQLLREQGAFISVSHPYDYQRKGWSPKDLEAIAGMVDAIEIFNARCLGSGFNEKAEQFALNHHLGGTTGSDAHLLWEVGKSRTILAEFSNADELRKAIPFARYEKNLSPAWVHFGSTFSRFIRPFYRQNDGLLDADQG